MVYCSRQPLNDPSHVIPHGRPSHFRIRRDRGCSALYEVPPMLARRISPVGGIQTHDAGELWSRGQGRCNAMGNGGQRRTRCRLPLRLSPAEWLSAVPDCASSVRQRRPVPVSPARRSNCRFAEKYQSARERDPARWESRRSAFLPPPATFLEPRSACSIRRSTV